MHSWKTAYTIFLTICLHWGCHEAELIQGCCSQDSRELASITCTTNIGGRGKKAGLLDIAL